MTADQADTDLYERARSQFPVFDEKLGHMAFMENAGGSQVNTLEACVPLNLQHCLYELCSGAIQVPACVADAIRHHLLLNNAQLGAGHELSKRSTAVVDKAHQVIKVSGNCQARCIVADFILAHSTQALPAGSCLNICIHWPVPLRLVQNSTRSLFNLTHLHKAFECQKPHVVQHTDQLMSS